MAPRTIDSMLHRHEEAVRDLIDRMRQLGRPFLLATDLNEVFDNAVKEGAAKKLLGTPIENIFHEAEEAVVHSSNISFSLRRGVGRWEYYTLFPDILQIKEIQPEAFLVLKERVFDPQIGNGEWVLKVDLGPFNRGFPRMRETRSIGRGVEFLNRHLSGRLFNEREGGDELIHEFLRLHQHKGQQLMLSNRIDTVDKLHQALEKAIRMLEKLSPDAPVESFKAKLAGFGFEPGWGNNQERTLETMELLQDLLEAPSPDLLETFLARIPMIFSVAILTPHGFFAQKNVLGLPDTGGQIVYILDQVRALEKEMIKRAEENGLDIQPDILVITRLLPDARGTTCDQPRENVEGTKYARIVRVPFRRPTGEVVPHWISRFKVWPYLERFSIEVEQEIRKEIGGRPDLLIGNYSDGNLVASLLSQRLGVTQCNIAHALEKTKYLYSAMYWQDNEEQYHFSCHYSADLIAMNSADFVITSTYQEIAGNEKSQGQYESYQTFTMPGLFRVVNGIDIYDPKFNIVSPGADPEVYFPYFEHDRRSREEIDEMEKVIFEPDREGTRGEIVNRDKPFIFLISRLDVIKNVTGFVRWYAEHPELKERANLLVAAGSVNPDDSSDDEEREQILVMHRLIDEYDLEDKVRWVGRVSKEDGAALYRHVADTKGIFVQPALFEAFGLTVIEAMSSGLPTFATRYGGPLEIIVNDVSGYHIDPNRGEWSAELINDFFKQCEASPDTWERISKGAIDRVREKYTWKLYADRLLTLSRIYGFWKFMSNLKRQETRRYLQMFYGLVHRARALEIEA